MPMQNHSERGSKLRSDRPSEGKTAAVDTFFLLKQRILLLALACTGSAFLWGCGGGQVDSPAEAAHVLPAGSGHDHAMTRTSQQGTVDAEGAAAGQEAIDFSAPSSDDSPADTQTRRALGVQTDAPEVAAVGRAEPDAAGAAAPLREPAPLSFGPAISRLELVASNGISELQPLPNHWGQHQTRVTVHTDGTVRVLYMALGSGGALNWRLMRRAPTNGLWSAEATGSSVDDVQLVRNPVNDAAHVVAWPNSVATVYTSPTFSPDPIPSRWQLLSAASRHYSSTGIGSDGSLCFKASLEQASTVPTTNTLMQSTCGRFDIRTRRWSWSPQMTQLIGNRRAYDYLFPGGFGRANQLVGTAQIDVHKSVLGLSALPASQGDYVFNGVSSYSVNSETGLAWNQINLVPPLLVPSSVKQSPVLKQLDAFIDRSQRMFSLYFSTDPLARTPDGFYLKVTNSQNVQLFASQLTALPAHGFARVVDDAQGRLWLLWSNLGTQMSQMVLYRIQLAAGRITLSDPTDLSSQLSPYALQGSPLLAVPRGGQLVNNAIDGVLVACDGFFSRGRLPSCYPAGVNRQRIVSFRIQLPR